MGCTVVWALCDIGLSGCTARGQGSMGFVVQGTLLWGFFSEIMRYGTSAVSSSACVY